MARAAFDTRRERSPGRRPYSASRTLRVGANGVRLSTVPVVRTHEGPIRIVVTQISVRKRPVHHPTSMAAPPSSLRNDWGVAVLAPWVSRDPVRRTVRSRR